MENFQTEGIARTPAQFRKNPNKFERLRASLKKHRSQQEYSEHQDHLFGLLTRSSNISRKELLDYRIHLWKKSTPILQNQPTSIGGLTTDPSLQSMQSEDSVSDIDSEFIIKCKKKKTQSEIPRSCLRLADELCIKQ